MKHHWITSDTPDYLLDKPSDTPDSDCIPTSTSSKEQPSPEMAQEERSFHLFPQLPLEIRQKIWRLSLEPRVLELHSRRTHYAQAEDWPWRSDCFNPALLSVCDEARGEALGALTVALPMPHGGMLYCDPMRDVLVVLGDSDLPRLRRLFAEVEDQDPRGLRHLALSVACWAHDYAGPTLRIWQRALFHKLDRLTLYLVLVDRFKQFRGRGDSWMVVGKAQIRIEELVFMAEDGSRLE
ncbi:pectinesterase precursor [Apiospora hydei]|uniref:Pectinesterase n=1 Tax=Apiospora hydei TaxID=1337664 RepID=A0ABR1UV07_9PEZI